MAHLPQESALARAMGWWWSDEHELAAVCAEVGHATFRATLAAAGMKQNDLPPPLNVPRPGTPAPPPKPSLSRESMRAVLGGR